MKKFLLVLSVVTILLPVSSMAELELPLPRFVSLKSGEANIRKGPGLNYPIKWVLVRKDMPVEIIAEFEQWRKIRDIDGEEGWVHRAMLNGKRTVTILNYNHTMYKNAGDDSSPVAMLETGVNAQLIECDEAWCRVEANNYRGWIEREGLWGLYKDEVLN